MMNAMIGYAQSNTQYILYDQNEMVIENIRIIDVINQKVLYGYSMLISNGKIDKIDKTNRLEIPETATRIDMNGKTVLPGLVMLHEHMNYFSGRAVWDSHPFSFPKLFLAAGVTTLRTAGAENPMYDLNLKRRIDKGEVVGPNMFVTGPMFNDSTGGYLGDFIISNYEEARKATAFWAEKGCTSFKVYSEISTDALKGVIDEAHSRGLMVTGHLGEMSCSEAIELGIDNIEHGFGSCFDDEGDFDAKDKEVLELVDLLIEKGVVLTITPFSDSDFGDYSLLQYLSYAERKRIEEFIKDKPPFLMKESNELKHRLIEKLFVSKGGRLVLGADASDFGLIPGFQNHNVLVSMVKGGWTPIEVIKMATLDGAIFLNIDNELGSINVGKIADFIVVSGKPDETITDIKNIDIVFHNGIGYNPKALREAAKGLVGRH